ncbi:hypothetical protein AAVH_36657, partial [Aphelenchoides avenae]
QIERNAEKLRSGFLQLMRAEYEHFELCEFYAFWCFAATNRKIGVAPEALERYRRLRPTVFSALSNRKNYECAGSSIAAGAANQLCQAVFGVDCL